MISQDVDNHLVSFLRSFGPKTKTHVHRQHQLHSCLFNSTSKSHLWFVFVYIHSTTNSTFASHTKYEHRARNHVQSSSETDSTWDHGAAMGLDEMVPRICFMMFFNEECGRLWAKLALLLTTWLHQNLHVPQR